MKKKRRLLRDKRGATLHVHPSLDQRLVEFTIIVRLLPADALALADKLGVEAAGTKRRPSYRDPKPTRRKSGGMVKQEPHE